jgi:hypothetical protein
MPPRRVKPLAIGALDVGTARSTRRRDHRNDHSKRGHAGSAASGTAAVVAWLASNACHERGAQASRAPLARVRLRPHQVYIYI